MRLELMASALRPMAVPSQAEMGGIIQTSLALCFDGVMRLTFTVLWSSLSPGGRRKSTQRENWIMHRSIKLIINYPPHIQQ